MTMIAITHGKQPPCLERPFLRGDLGGRGADGSKLAKGGGAGSLSGVAGSGRVMLVTLPMITKKILLASAALLSLGGWGVSQMVGSADAQGDAGLAVTTAAEGDSDDMAVATTMMPPKPLEKGKPLSPANKDAADLLFDDETVGETRALLVMKNGKIVYERYGEGFGEHSRLYSWSMGKTITAVLIGFLVSDGRLSLDGPAPVDAWQRSGDPRGAISLRHLLHMASGLDHHESLDDIWKADTPAMLFGEGAGDMAGFAEAKPAIAAAGEVFNYSSATTVILSDIVADTLTPSKTPSVRRDAVLEFMRGRLIEPLGMTSLTPEFDARGTMIGGSFMHATARDYARFGEFLRLHGVANGHRLLPESWMDFMLSPSPADHGYGGHIWLNRQRPAGSPAALWPQRGPNDMFAAIGHQGQYIIMSPSQRLTIVRLGISDDEEFPALRRRLANLTESL
jgi:CubicO group peptidase (beta-lactamase class C family)